MTILDDCEDAVEGTGIIMIISFIVKCISSKINTGKFSFWNNLQEAVTETAKTYGFNTAEI